MKMVKYYLLAGILLCVIAAYVPYWWINVVILWTAASLFAVCVAYLTNYPELFRKREDGRIPVYVRWLFIPFLLGARLYNFYERKTDKVPNIQKIEEQLYLGTRLVGSDIEKLSNQGIDCILDVTAEFDGLDWTSYRYDVDYLNIPVLDHASPTNEQLHLALNWIDQHIRDNRKILVHCALGRGRSVLVMAAYLLARNDALSVIDVMNKIQSVRATARLNKHQLKSLSAVKQRGRLKLNTQLALIANPVAGGGKWKTYKEEILSHLNSQFRVTIYETTPELNATWQARQAVTAGNEILIACGGDGTVTEVATVTREHQKVLGIIPLGTANALSQIVYGLRSRLAPITRACEVICEQQYTPVDTAECNGKLMLLVSAIGFESQMIEHADREEKNSGGQMAYLEGLWKAMNTSNPQKLQVTLDDESFELDTPSFVIANAAPLSTALAQGGDLPDMTDGKLDITWLTPTEDDMPLFTVAELVFGNEQSKKSSQIIHHKRAKQVSIKLPEEQTYVIDGETYTTSEITVNCQARNLNILADSKRFDESSEVSE